MFNQCKPAEAIGEFSGDPYILHNPEVGDGKEPFIAYFEKMAREYAGKRVTIKRGNAEEDTVVLHCLQDFPHGADRQIGRSGLPTDCRFVARVRFTFRRRPRPLRRAYYET